MDFLRNKGTSRRKTTFGFCSGNLRRKGKTTSFTLNEYNLFHWPFLIFDFYSTVSVEECAPLMIEKDDYTAITKCQNIKKRNCKYININKWIF